jgi:hypothetical protein
VLTAGTLLPADASFSSRIVFQQLRTMRLASETLLFDNATARSHTNGGLMTSLTGNSLTGNSLDGTFTGTVRTQ